MRTNEDRIAVVTGASGGIGRAAAVELARQGASVALLARRTSSVEEVADECRDLGVEVLAMGGDVTRPDDLELLADRTVGRFGRIDAWVNNAAVHLFAPVEEAPTELWHRVIETNLFGTYHGVRAALPAMRAQGRGVIVNVASVLAHVAAPTQSAYVASKFAIRGLSDCVRQEVRDTDIKVCTVLPGPVDTPLFRHAANHTGRDVTPLSPVIDARRVADAIALSVRRPRRERVVGVQGRQIVALSRLAPGLADRLSAWVVERDHFADRPADAWRGNLLAPLDERGQVSGGWTRAGEFTARGGRRRRITGATRMTGPTARPTTASPSRPHRTGRAHTHDEPDEVEVVEDTAHVDVDGTRLHLRSWAPRNGVGRTSATATDPATAPLVMVHGLGVASRMCRPAAQLLARRRRVLAPDLPGFGRSPAADDVVGPVEHAEVIGRWLEHESLPPVHLVGVSIGTQVVAEVAARRPERCRTVVLASPTVEAGRREWPTQLRRWRREQRTQSWTFRALMVRDVLRCGPRRMVATFDRALRHRIEHRLGHVVAPVLVCRGTQDPLVSRRWAQEVTDRCPDATLRVLPGVPHAMSHDAALEFQRVLEAFLEDHGHEEVS